MPTLHPSSVRDIKIITSLSGHKMNVGPRVTFCVVIVTGLLVGDYGKIATIVVTLCLLNFLQLILSRVPVSVERYLMKSVEYCEDLAIKIIIRLWNYLVKLGQACLTIKKPEPPTHIV